MIHVDRKQVPVPDILRPGGKGAEEMAKAKQFYSDPANQNETFSFKVYSSDPVKQALADLFHGKCAYCESVYAATQPPDVEHYRPKGGYILNGKLKKPGYYWLAAVWDNLLPSCIDCNRARRQDIPGEGIQNVGKENQFPLVDESKRATAPGAENKEGRLLLDPCQDEPEQHLLFIEDGGVSAAPLSSGSTSPMGEASIDVYALQRPGLIDARRDRLLLIQTQLKRIGRIALRIENDPTDEAAAEDLRSELDELSRLLQPSQPYLGMARQFVKRDPVLAALGFMDDQG